MRRGNTALQEQRHEPAQRHRVLQGNISPLQALDRTLDKGVVAQHAAGVRLLGIDLLTVDEHGHAASLATLLKRAKAMEQPAPLPQSHPAGVIKMDDGEHERWLSP